MKGQWLGEEPNHTTAPSINPSVLSDADPDPAFHSDANPDPGYKKDADPDPQHCFHV